MAAEVWKALDHQHGRVVALKMRPIVDGGHREHLLAVPGLDRLVLTG